MSELHNISKRLIIVNSTSYIKNSEGIWLPPNEWKSLRQWWQRFSNVRLLKPQKNDNTIPEGWLKVPPSVDVSSLCSERNNRIIRRYQSEFVARSVLKPNDILVARMPNYEAAWCARVARKQFIRVIIELHGDWETAVLEEDHQGVLYRATKDFRAKLNKKTIEGMAAYACCAITIGPHLSSKYVPKTTPALTSTNHLLSEKEFDKKEKLDLHKPPRILFVGDLQRRKGLKYLFEALAKLKAEGTLFTVDMAGSGPMKEPLRSYAKKNNFENMIKFHGKIAHGAPLFNLFKKADVFVLPSIASEGVPRAIHEAMAFGVPVIASDIGSIAWQLQGGAGVVVRPFNSEEIADAISTVLSNKRLRENLSERGYERSKQFTLERQQKLLMDFVQSQISPSG